MKKTITIALLLVLTVCLLAGCRRGNDAESMITDASQAIDDMMPSSDSGAATDHDGFIGDDNSTSNSTTGSTNGDANGSNSGSTSGGTNGGSSGNTNGGTNGSANGGTNGGTNDGTNNGNGARSGGFLPIHY